jgi:serine/threonine protein phosphatase 1
MRRFVMGDIHGGYKALMQCFERSGFDYTADQLIQLGDVADGYSQVYECVEELLKIKNLISIKGNHDEWFNQFCLMNYHPQNWSQGGKGTALSYLKYTPRKSGIFSNKYFGFNTLLTNEDIPDAHRTFFKSQILYYLDHDNNCFVHAGFNRWQSFFEQHDETYYWDRSLWLDALEYEKNKGRSEEDFQMVTGFNKIFIGHTCTGNWNSDVPMHAANVINLDTDAGWGGKLSMMEISTGRLWQSDPNVHLYGYLGR